MRHFLRNEARWRASFPTVFLCKGRKASTGASSHGGDTRESALPPPRPPPPPNAASAGSSKSTPAPSSASPSWVQGTLHYDTAKVQQLADLLTGASSADSFAALSKGAGASKRASSHTATTVEEQLRHPAYQTASKKKRNSASSRGFSQQQEQCCTHPNSDAVLSQRQKSSGNDSSSSGDKVNAELLRSWTSALLGSTDPSMATLLKGLLSLHASVQRGKRGAASSFAASSGTLSEEQVLVTLFRKSRLHWHRVTNGGTALAVSSEDDIFMLCLLAAALEASLRCFRETGTIAELHVEHRSSTKRESEKAGNETRDGQYSDGVAQSLHLWRGTCMSSYNRLFAQLLTLLTSALVKHNRQQRNSATSSVQVDALLSSLLSLLHVLDGCASDIETTVNSAARQGSYTASKQHVSSLVLDQRDLFERLCVAASAAVAFWGSSITLPIEAAALVSGNSDAQLQYITISVASFRKQLTNFQAKLSVVSRLTLLQGCVQGVASTLFCFCISALRRSLAVEVAGLHSTKRAASDASASADATLRQCRARVALAEQRNVTLATHAEALLSMLHPLPVAPHAAQAHMQYRSTSTTLSFFLSSLWHYSAKVQAAQSLATSTRHQSASTSVGCVEKGDTKGEGADAALSTAATSVVLFSVASSFWERHLSHVALLLISYYDVLTRSSDVLGLLLSSPGTSTTKSASVSSTLADGLAWVVPFCSRVVRVGMSLQMDTSLLAAAHLGLEAAAPRSPSTPLEKVMASRRKSRRAKQPFALNSESQGMTDALNEAETSGSEGCSDGAPRGNSRLTQVAEEERRGEWARVFRLSGGLRVASCEVLHRVVVDLAALCASDTPAAAHRHHSRQRNSPPVAALVEAVARVLFCAPRTEYLLGLYTDDVLSSEAAVEQSRRIYGACVGVFLWLRELSPSFGSHFTSGEAAEGALPQHTSAPSPHDASEQANAWLVCGTTKANALEAAFFATYLLHHWPSQGDAALSRPRPLRRQGGGQERQGAMSPLMRALTTDGVVSLLPPSSTDSILSSTNAEAYVAETLFFLQHDTASLLRHLRTTDRFYHFSGEKKDKTQLMEEDALRRRHVASTLSVVMAFQKQPNFVWMPLETAQEIVFELLQFPGLVATATPEGSAAARIGRELQNSGVEAGMVAGEREDRYSAVDANSARVYPKVQVGRITCTLARAHGYLVRRLHVLSGVLREYRSVLLKTPAALESKSSAAFLRTEADAATPTSTPSPQSVFASRLLANASHAPQDTSHRRSNYHWAHPWATMLREDFAFLPAEVEGTPRWTTGVLRVMERMELLMYDTHRQGLFINVVKSQQQYKSQMRLQSFTREQTGEYKNEDAAVERTVESSERAPVVLELSVTRMSPRVPLGVAVDGSGFVLRVQTTVSAPMMRGAGEDGADESATASYEEMDEVTSPFAAALAHCGDGGGAVEIARVIGRRIASVDGVTVRSGRDVAAQVRNKTAFLLTIEG